MRRYPSMTAPAWRFVCAAAMLAIASMPAHAQSVVEPFSGPTPGPGWTLSGDAVLTGTGGIDPVGAGWLRLNPDTGGMGFAYHDSVVSTAGQIVVAFDFAATGGSAPPADGISFFLFDASTPFQPGDGGGSYGYQGMDNGALAIGIDDGYGSGFVSGVSNAIGVAGPGPSTSSIANSGSLAPTPWTSARGLTPADADFRRITITLSPAGSGAMSVTVQLQRGGSVSTVLSGIVVSGLPSQVRFGLSAATGGNVALHEVRNFSLQAQHVAGEPVPTLGDLGIAMLAALLAVTAFASRRRAR